MGSRDCRRHVLPWTVFRDRVGKLQQERAEPQQEGDGELLALGTRPVMPPPPAPSPSRSPCVRGQGPGSSRCASWGPPCPPTSCWSCGISQAESLPPDPGPQRKCRHSLQATCREPTAFTWKPPHRAQPAWQMPSPQAGASGWPLRALPCPALPSGGVGAPQIPRRGGGREQAKPLVVSYT